MKLLNETINILENFADINNGIVIRKTPDGEEKTAIRTIAETEEIFATATVPNVFPVNVSIYDLKTFLGIVKVAGKDAELHFDETFVTIKDENSETKFGYADPNTIIHPEKNIVLPESDIEFTLMENDLKKIFTFGNMLSLKHLRFFTKDGAVYGQAVDGKNVNSNTTQVKLCDTDKQFNFFISRENIKFLPGNYKVKVVPGAAVQITQMENPDVKYFVALDTSV